MKITDPTEPPATNPDGVLRHVMSADGIARVHAAILDAGNTRQLLSGIVNAIYGDILATNKPSDGDSEASEAVRPHDYALPASQWEAIFSTALQRAQKWRGTAEAGVELALSLMPLQYTDPSVPTPRLPLPDDRPLAFGVVVDRDAMDVITTCDDYLDKLSDAYGAQSEWYTNALHAWYLMLSAIVMTNAAPITTVSGNGPMGLLVRTGIGRSYTVTFYGYTRRCTDATCRARIDDDGTASPAADGTAIRDHQHTPSYRLDGPQPGIWIVLS